MLSFRKIAWTAVTLVLLGVAGYAHLNPAFAATCKSACDTGAAWARQRAETVGKAFKSTGFYTSVAKEKQVLDVRIEKRKKAAAAAKITRQQAVAATQTRRVEPPAATLQTHPADVSSVTVCQPEHAGWSEGRRIAQGHAFAKHGKDFGFTTESQMASHVDRVVGRSRSSDVRRLSRGRTAYWDDGSGSVVIVDPNTRDGGTTFKPNRGRAYFESLK